MSEAIPVSSVTHREVYAADANDPFGYFGWPTVTSAANGEVTIAASGFRNAHICPFGKAVVWRSSDGGESFAEPEIAAVSSIDLRDCGVLALPDGSVLLSYFTSDTRFALNEFETVNGCKLEHHGISFDRLLSGWSDEMVRGALGSFVRIMRPDGTISPEYRVPVTAPHGPVLQKSGDLLYLGKKFCVVPMAVSSESPAIQLYRSTDGGCSWQCINANVVADAEKFCEPHVIELSPGRLLGLLRNATEHFSIWQTDSEDGGLSWSTPRYICDGAPPHLMRHSSGVLICTYGYRKPPYGERVMFSRDEGRTWESPRVLRDDGFSADLGYASTAELPDGSLFSCYYQAPGRLARPGILATQWRLP